MSGMVIALALSGLFGCYDIATRMTARTHHGIRVGVILIGLGCIGAMAGRHEWAVLLILAGLGLFRLFDKRLYAREDAAARDAIPAPFKQALGSFHHEKRPQ